MVSKYWGFEYLPSSKLCAQRLFEGFTRRLSPAGDTFTTRTIKILSGDHFQWIPINSAAKEFSGTGGGIYPANNRFYNETIEFFSG
ncbi:MAG: hypothetical protein MUP24_00645 [Gillisia sp.]|nr:hypothetical protein [Gillisia sp.]